MEVEKLQELNDQKRYIAQLENFKERVFTDLIMGKKPDSIIITVETNFNDRHETTKIPIFADALMSYYDSFPMRDEDQRSFSNFIDGIVEKEKRKFQEM